MNLIEKATIIRYHRHRLETYAKGTVESLGWKQQTSQAKRYEVLTTVGDLDGASVLDMGCGYGDLKGYLDQIASNFTYLGIDQMPEFIEHARERFRDHRNTDFFQTDFTTVDLPEVDYVIASGALGYRCDAPDFYTDMIGRMYASARRALAFNMLDVHRFPDHPLLVGHDCEEITEFCRSLSPCVKVTRGYLEDDFTVFLYRECPA